MRTQDFNNNFKTTEDYFENQEFQLINKWAVNFEVPENYFENQEKVLLNIASKREHKKKQIRKYIIGTSVAAFMTISTIIGWNVIHQNSIDQDSFTDAHQVINELYIEEIDNAEAQDLNLNEPHFGEAVTQNRVAIESIEHQYSTSKAIEKTTIKKEKEATEILYDLYLDEDNNVTENEIEWDESYIL